MNDVTELNYVLIRITRELIAKLFTRDADGNRLTLSLGPQGADGVYVPTISVDYTDNLLTDWLACRLGAAGFTPDFNVCASCKHHGGDHDLNNKCLICGDRFRSMTGAEQWSHGLAALREQP